MSTISKSVSPSDIKASFEKKSVSASLSSLSSLIQAAKLDLKDFSDDLEYSGFDRERIAKLCGERFGPRGTAKLILVGVKRGTRIDKILKTCVKVDKDLKAWVDSGDLKTGGKGPDTVSIGRILACFPDCAVYIGLLFAVKGKFSIPNCHPAIQFPAAASLPMSPVVRAAHITFCKQFGALIKSPFNPDYYKIAFSSMLSISVLSKEVLAVLGNPDDQTARNIDIDMAMESDGGVHVGRQSRSHSVSSKKGKERSSSSSGDLSRLFQPGPS